jgi:hypothetical protein
MPTYEHIFQAAFKGETTNGVVRNVFHFVPDEAVLNGNDAAKALADELASAAFLAGITNILSADVTFTQIRVTDLADTDVLYEKSVSVAGEQSATSAPPFVAIAYRAQQPAVGVHAAEKRFGPIALNTIEDNGMLAAGIASDLANVQTILNSTISTDDDGLFVSDWHMVLVPRIKVGALPGRTYHLPEPGDFPATAYPTANWDWNRRASSQNTRKFGRGE